MPRAICRCGQTLEVPPGDSVRIVCPGCGARVRVRPGGPSAPGATPPAGSAPALPSDGFLRFSCPCGRRLKVSATEPPPHGQCPDCGAIVPIPRPSASALPTGHPETPTAELSAAELANLERWTRDHLARATSSGVEPSTTRLDPMAVETKTAELAPRSGVGSARVEVGLRTCPNPACLKPLHLSAEVCPHCGTPTPRR